MQIHIAHIQTARVGQLKDGSARCVRKNGASGSLIGAPLNHQPIRIARHINGHIHAPGVCVDTGIHINGISRLNLIAPQQAG